MKAQEVRENNKKQSMGGGGFTIGYGNADVSAFKSFVPETMGKFKNDFLVIGGTGHAIINKFVIGGSGFAIATDPIKTDSISASLGGGIGTFDIGYLFFNKDKIKIYSVLGIGGGGLGLQIAKNKNISASKVASDPGQEININHGGFVADVSVHMNIIPAPAYDEKKESYGGFMFGLKIGYTYSLPSNDWTFSGGDITGGPNFGLSMLYAKLIIGGFGSQKTN